MSPRVRRVCLLPCPLTWLSATIRRDPSLLGVSQSGELCLTDDRASLGPPNAHFVDRLHTGCVRFGEDGLREARRPDVPGRARTSTRRPSGSPTGHADYEVFVSADRPPREHIGASQAAARWRYEHADSTRPCLIVQTGPAPSSRPTTVRASIVPDTSRVTAISALCRRLSSCAHTRS
jgi:hypothetical protein